MATTVPDFHTVREAIFDALVEVTRRARAELDAAAAAVGDDYLIELDSKTAEFVLVAVEAIFGRRMPTPADLGPELYSTVGALVDAVLDQLSGVSA